MRYAAALLLFAALLGGCAKREQSQSPQSVALKYWQAVKEGDMRLAKSMTIRGSMEEPLIKAELLDVKVSGARVVNGRAFVPTGFSFRLPVDSFKNIECNSTMDTELLKVEGRWLIDDVVTMRNYDRAVQEGTAACTSGLLKDALKKGMKSFESVKKELEEGFSGVAKEFEKSFKDIQKQLQKSLEQLQRELSKERPELPEPEKGQKI
ncbi:hypothetical protein NNO_0751 [Hydrogenimonas sp.]|nr:hypothetical protein NNO_0751 [Hydrogenimonas sp.]